MVLFLIMWLKTKNTKLAGKKLKVARKVVVKSDNFFQIERPQLCALGMIIQSLKGERLEKTRLQGTRHMF